MENLIQEHKGQSDAIALNGASSRLRVGNRSATFEPVHAILARESSMPLCDGSVLQPALERWGVRAAHAIEPGIWANKRILFLPQLNHTGMMETVSHYSSQIKSIDAKLFLNEATSQRNGLLGGAISSTSDKELIEKLTAQSFETLYGTKTKWD